MYVECFVHVYVTFINIQDKRSGLILLLQDTRFFPLEMHSISFFFCIQEIATQSSPRRFHNIFIFKVSNAVHTRQLFSPVTYQIGIFGFQEMNSKYILYS